MKCALGTEHTIPALPHENAPTAAQVTTVHTAMATQRTTAPLLPFSAGAQVSPVEIFAVATTNWARTLSSALASFVIASAGVIWRQRRKHRIRRITHSICLFCHELKAKRLEPCEVYMESWN